MKHFQASLRRKLILLITTVASVTVLIACAGLGFYQWTQASSALFEQETSTAQITADNSAAALLFMDKTAANETLAALHNDGRIQKACLYDKSGQLTASYRRGRFPATSCPNRPQIASVFTLRSFLIVHPVVVKASPVGCLTLSIGLDELHILAAKIAATALAATFLASLFALLVSAATEKWVSRPILELTKIAVIIAEHGDRKVRARFTSNDEVGFLIDRFNAMLDKLEEREGELREAYGHLEGKVEERTQTLRDEIAERKLIELDLSHAKDSAEAANKAKSRFLANMSHELRTPLNAIIGYSEMLVEDAEDPAYAPLRNDLVKILSSARHLLSLISDILDLSKIEAGQMAVHLENVPVGVVIQDVLPIAEVLMKANDNRFKVENNAPEAICRVDVLRFRQCLLNLLGNSAKFTTDGTITLRTSIRDRDQRTWLVWSVEDTGIGIAPEDISKLFESFSQVDGSATRKHGGSGLGLCISQQLCKAMSGWIEVSSKRNSGSTFDVWLPA